MTVADSKEYEGRMSYLEAELKGIKDYLVRMDGKLDAWQQNYVPRNELGEMFRARDKDIQDVSSEVDKLRDNLKEDQRSNKNLWPAWAAVIVSAAALWLSLGGGN